MAPDELTNIGTWNAWTEEKEGQHLLFVEGQLPTTTFAGEVKLVKTYPQGSDERDLLLTLDPRVQLDHPDRTLQLTYSEPLRHEHQYASITITDQGSWVARIVTIEHKQMA